MYNACKKRTRKWGQMVKYPCPTQITKKCPWNTSIQYVLLQYYSGCLRPLWTWLSLPPGPPLLPWKVMTRIGCMCFVQCALKTPTKPKKLTVLQYTEHSHMKFWTFLSDVGQDRRMFRTLYKLKLQGWEFDHRFFERFTRFLWSKEQ